MAEKPPASPTGSHDTVIRSGIEKSDAESQPLQEDIEFSNKLKRSRAGYQGHLSKLYQQAERYMVSFDNRVMVEGILSQIQACYDNVLESHNSYRGSLTDSESNAITQADQYLSQLNTNKTEFDSRVSGWLKRADMRDHDEHSKSYSEQSLTGKSHTSVEFNSDKDKRSDRLSEAGSLRSGGSRASVKLEEARVRQTLAKLRLKQVEKELKLREQYQRLDREQEMLKVQGKLELADAELSMWESEGSGVFPSASDKFGVDDTKPAADLHVVSRSPEQLGAVGPTTQVGKQSSGVQFDVKPFKLLAKPEFQQQSEVSAPAPVNSGMQARAGHSRMTSWVESTRPELGVEGVGADGTHLNPQAPVWQGHKPITRYVDSVAGSVDSVARSVEAQLADVMTSQAEAYQKMASSLKVSMNLPKPELITFQGDPTEYWRFISNFEASLGEDVEPRARLNFLIQHCKGEPKQAIQDCVILDPEAGYQKARQILEFMYGQPHVISQTYITRLTGGPPIKVNDGDGLTKLGLQMQQCGITLGQMGYVSDLNNSSNITSIVQRLPRHLKSRWADKAAETVEDKMREPTFDELTAFVLKRAKVANSRYGKVVSDNYSDKPSQQKKPQSTAGKGAVQRRTFSTQASSDGGKFSKDKCPLCEKFHNILDCEIFIKMSLRDRRALMLKFRLCFNCGEPGHIGTGCMQKAACSATGCDIKHHRLLHFERKQVSSSSHDKSSNVSSKQSISEKSDTDRLAGATAVKKSVNCSATGAGSQVCLKVVPVRVYSRDSDVTVDTFALLDDCSDVSLCSESLLDDLGVQGTETVFELATVSQSSRSRKGAEVSLSVESMDGTRNLELPKVWSIDSIPVSSENIPRASDVDQWPHLKGLNIPSVDIREVKLLIGADVPEAFWVLEQRRGRPKDPYAVRCPLGWTVVGHVGSETGTGTSQGHVNFISSQSKDQSVKDQLEILYNTEFGDLPADGDLGMSVQDKHALHMMENTLTMVDGHYQLGLPWREHPPPLKNNKTMAESRLQHLKQRLFRDNDLHNKYTAAMTDYIAKGHACEVPAEELDRYGGVWFLPHHPVQKPSKPHKVRVVFDCAARFGGTSLNDQLLTGPDLTNGLVGVLTRFREGPIALKADIEGMFNQVLVAPEDRTYLRFLWWPDGDLSSQPVQYQMKVHIFGATSSPSCVNFCLRQTASDNQGRFNESVIDSVLRHFYVDDYLPSVDEVAEGQVITQQIPALLTSGGFRIRDWVSNSSQVLADVADGDRSPTVDLDLDHSPGERALGIKWDVTSDTFWFETVRKDKECTRRGILSVVSSLFDPLGLVCPLTLPAKVLLQDLCREHYGWDEEIGRTYQERWNSWLDSLDGISQIRVNRCLVPGHMRKPYVMELHHFGDASQSGYGAGSYLRTTDAAGEVHCSLLMGKCRVTPLKSVSIPRLELSAAVLAVQLDKLLKKELDLPITGTVFWTDSTSVLQYINNESRRFHTFVANRVTKIHDASDPSQWRHVGTAQNPGDHASRGLLVSDTVKLKEWLQGPEFLWGPESGWPAPMNLTGLPDEDPEVKKGPARTLATKMCEEHVLSRLLNRCSSWMQLQRSVTWLLRYKSYCIRKYSKSTSSSTGELLTGDLKLKELQNAALEVVKHVQRRSFTDEVQQIACSSLVRKDSALRRLSPVLRDGLLCVGGRLERLSISDDAKHPAILPKKDPLTVLIIRHIHELEGHCGRNQTLATVRQKYWVVNGQSAVRGVLSKCIQCRKRNAPTGGQLMAPLPVSRLIPGQAPFSQVGLDYFGPFLVKSGRSERKRYGCIFTCMSSRAVHLEIAHSLETDSFICALQRFISRRGKPSHIYSDNGTNFRGGERELREAIHEWNSNKKVQDFLLQHEIEWCFNPPGASHMGGVWERLIRSVRQVLKSVLKEQFVGDETLVTMVTEVERILNDRPLTPLSDDISDLEPLTPSHILLLKGNPSIPPAVLSKEDSYGRRRWRQAQYLASVFWRRWIKEYLPTLQERQKWTKPTQNFAIGDLVLVTSDTLPRGQWPLGRIEEVFPDVHGHVRAVIVRTATGKFRRPVTCLCLLESQSSDEEAPLLTDAAKSNNSRETKQIQDPIAGTAKRGPVTNTRTRTLNEVADKHASDKDSNQRGSERSKRSNQGQKPRYLDHYVTQ